MRSASRRPTKEVLDEPLSMEEPQTRPTSAAHVITGRIWAIFEHSSIALQLVVYLLLWPILEVLFLFRVRRYVRLRSAQKLAHHSADTAEVERFWMRILKEEDAAGVDTVLRGWFLGEGPICEGNLEELVGWTLYAKPVHTLAGAKRTRVSRVLARLIRKVGSFSSFPAGRNPNRTCMLHTLQPLEPCWKPLGFYLGVKAVREACWILLRRRGFVLRTHGALRYWLHTGSAGGSASSTCSSSTSGGGTPVASDDVSTPASSPPIVVLHGVGGLVPYVPFLLQLRSTFPTTALIVPFLTHCSLITPAYEPPAPVDTTEVVHGLAAAVRAEAGGRGGAGASAPKAVFFGHSLGTAILASIVKSYPTLIGGAMFVDPICFLLYQKDVVYNFLYACPAPLRHGPRQALHASYWFRFALHYLLKLEPTIQSAFRREFWWGRHWLHPHDLPCPSVVSLSGRDAIVPSHKVAAYLSACEARVIGGEQVEAATAEAAATAAAATAPPRMRVELHEKRHHGWGVIDPFARTRLVAHLRDLLKQASTHHGTHAHVPAHVPVAEADGGKDLASGETEEDSVTDETYSDVDDETDDLHAGSRLVAATR